MPTIFQRLQGEWGTITPDGKDIIVTGELEPEKPEITRFVEVHEERHLEQRKNGHERHKDTEAEADLSVLKYATTEGARPLLSPARTSLGEALMKKVARMLNFYQEYGGEIPIEDENYCEDIRAARKAGIKDDPRREIKFPYKPAIYHPNKEY